MARNRKRKQLSSRELQMRKLASLDEVRPIPLPIFMSHAPEKSDSEKMVDQWMKTLSKETRASYYQVIHEGSDWNVDGNRRIFANYAADIENTLENNDAEKGPDIAVSNWTLRHGWAKVHISEFAEIRKLVPKEIVPLEPLLFLAALTCPRDQRDAVIGDMRERYPKDCATWGSTWAKLLIVRDLIATIGPMIWSLGRKGTMKVLKALGAAEMVRRFMG